METVVKTRAQVAQEYYVDKHINGVHHKISELDIKPDTIYRVLRTYNDESPVYLLAFPDQSGILLEKCSYSVNSERKSYFVAMEAFMHQIDESTFQNMLDADHYGTSDEEDELIVLFKDDINKTLSDPFYFDGDEIYDRSDLHFNCGDEESLTELVRYIIYTSKNYSLNSGKEYISLVSTCDKTDDTCGVSEDNNNFDLTIRDIHLINLACELNEFHGWETNYNDGARDMHSGYNIDAIGLDIEIPEMPSAHALLMAESKLRALFAKYEIDYDKIIIKTDD